MRLLKESNTFTENPVWFSKVQEVVYHHFPMG